MDSSKPRINRGVVFYDADDRIIQFFCTLLPYIVVGEYFIATNADKIKMSFLKIKLILNKKINRRDFVGNRQVDKLFKTISSSTPKINTKLYFQFRTSNNVYSNRVHFIHHRLVSHFYATASGIGGSTPYMRMVASPPTRSDPTPEQVG